MSKIQKQILKNQATILLALSDDGRCALETIVSIKNRMTETKDALEKNSENIKEGKLKGGNRE